MQKSAGPVGGPAAFRRLNDYLSFLYEIIGKLWLNTIKVFDHGESGEGLNCYR